MQSGVCAMPPSYGLTISIDSNVAYHSAKEDRGGNSSLRRRVFTILCHLGGIGVAFIGIDWTLRLTIHHI